MRRIAVIAALPGELHPLVRGWRPVPSAGGIECWRRTDAQQEVTAACAGMGAVAAARALAAAEAAGPADRVFSVGWAGALREGLGRGKAYVVGMVIDGVTGERFSLEPGPGRAVLVTAPAIADEAQKRRLASRYCADLVDMEAAALARLARSRGIAFRCLKAVTDEVADRVPDLAPFVAPDGRLRAGRFALHSLARPWQWPALVRLGRNSRQAAAALQSALASHPDYVPAPRDS